MQVVRVHGGVNLEIKVIIGNSASEEVKIDIDSNSKVSKLKEEVYKKNKNLGADDMGLTYASVYLEDEKKLSDYKIISGSTLSQSKGKLKGDATLIVSYDDDLLGMGDPDMPNAMMPCKHVISTYSMTSFLRS